MLEIKKLTIPDGNEEKQIYPITHEDAIVTSDGKKLGDKLSELDSAVFSGTGTDVDLLTLEARNLCPVGGFGYVGTEYPVGNNDSPMLYEAFHASKGDIIVCNTAFIFVLNQGAKTLSVGNTITCVFAGEWGEESTYTIPQDGYYCFGHKGMVTKAVLHSERVNKIESVENKVEDLARKVEEIEPFVAEYGVTTYAEVKEAYDNKRPVVVYRDNNKMELQGLFGNDFCFSTCHSANTYQATLKPTNAWSYAIYYYERTNNRTQSITSASTSTQYPSAKAVYDYVESKGGGSSTPSGDPCHYMYVEAGALWNEQTGCWEMNGINDLTTDEIRYMYVHWVHDVYAYAPMNGWEARTNFPFRLHTLSYSNHLTTTFFCKYLMSKATTLEVLALWDDNVSVALTYDSINWLADQAGKTMAIRKILGIIFCENITGVPFYPNTKLPNLEYVRLNNVKGSCNLSGLPVLSNECILYMITNANTTATTITLHADAYARAQADSAIQAALTTKTNVTLVSA